MASCQDVYTFLTQVSNRNVTGTLAPADLATLQQLNLLQVVSADQYGQFTKEVESLSAEAQTISQKTAERAMLLDQVREETAKTHSVLFHFEGRDKQAAEVQKETQDETSLQSLDSDLTAEEQQYDQAMARRSVLDTLTPFAGGYVALTGAGTVALRDLGTCLYRVSDLPFTGYLAQTQEIDAELNDIANQSAQYFSVLSPSLVSVDRPYLWAIAIGLAKRENDINKGARSFLDAYNGLGKLAHNEENRLMSAEIVSVSPRSLADNLPILKQLDASARAMGVPKESSLGVASILLLGQRADGTFATDALETFLHATPSFESAALMAIVNRPFADVSGKFGAVRSMFAGWGFQDSEDVELSSAYIAVSDLPTEGLAPKLQILTRGLGAYLQYPLVAAAILASIPVLEANESLHLLEQAYDIIGKRAMPLSQPELICLAVRMIHGIRSETVTGLDTTARAVPSPPVNFHYMPGMWFFFVPIYVGHGAYFSTFGAFGGAHPALVHTGGLVG